MKSNGTKHRSAAVVEDPTAAPAIRQRAAAGIADTAALRENSILRQWSGPLTDKEQALIDRAWETHAAAKPPTAETSEKKT